MGVHFGATASHILLHSCERGSAGGVGSAGGAPPAGSLADSWFGSLGLSPVAFGSADSVCLGPGSSPAGLGSSAGGVCPEQARANNAPAAHRTSLVFELDSDIARSLARITAPQGCQH